MAMNSESAAPEVVQRLAAVRERIARACQKAGRSEGSVRLIAVSKGHAASLVRAAYGAGQREFGENYMQEASAKCAELSELTEIRWRFIGRLQHNKAKEAARLGCAVDSVDSERLAEALDRRAQALGRKLEVMIQVNVAREAQKTGCDVEEVARIAAAVRNASALNLVGLMTIPPAAADPEQSRSWFRALRHLGEQHGLKELSMGMSDDLEVAVEEGATLVRVGTAIFGQR
jgi:pyridoxal phosphate enzyme (YggS family)